MSTEPLPKTLDVRKAATRGVSVDGDLEPADLPRFRQLLAGDGGTIAASSAFYRDEEHRYVIRIEVTAEVSVTCQRCLLPMPLQLRTDNTLAVVWSDDQAQHLPRSLEPLIIAEDEPGNLWDLVEEELILSMPPFNYHDTDECREILADYSTPPAPEGAENDRSNPFNVLARLKPGDQTRS